MKLTVIIKFLLGRSCNLNVSALIAVAAVMVLLSPVISVPAIAQDGDIADIGLEEIVVTARRRDESLKDVATSVTVFSGESILRNGIEGINEYVLRTPNVSLEETGTRNENRLAMRGVSNIGGGLNSSFAFYVDELNIQSVTTNPQLQDVRSIEVLRGPQGTFFGRNALGGAINIQTERPGPEFEGGGFLGFGNFGAREISGTINVPLVDDKFFLRAVGYYSEIDGFIDNVNAAGGTDNQEYFNGRVAARWLASDRLTFDFSVMNTDEQNGLETGVPTHALSPGTLNLIGPVPVTDGLTPYPANESLVNNDNPKSIDYNFTVYNGRFEYVGDSISLTGITGYIEGERIQNGDVDATSFDAINLLRDSERDAFSQEIRLASVGDGAIDWVVGALYADENLDVDLEVLTGNDIQIFIPVAPPQFPVRTMVQSGNTESWAVFGEFDWNVSDRLTLTYGGRYSDDSVTQEESGTNFGQPAVFPRKTASFDEFTSRVAAVFDASDDVSMYAVVSQGYKTGGIQLDPSLQSDSFDPETVWNYEAGIRGSLFNDTSWLSATVFRMDWEDLQVRTLVNSFVNDVFILVEGTDNAAEASSTGVELEFRSQPTENFQFGMTAGYLDAEFDNYQDAIIGGIPVPIDVSGHRLLNAPEFTASADGQLDFSVGSKNAFVRAEWAYRSETVTSMLAYVPQSILDGLIPGLDFQFPYRTPSFDVWNIRAGIDQETYGVTAYVENAFDDNYYTGTFDDLFWSGVHVRVHPRTYGIRLWATF